MNLLNRFTSIARVLDPRYPTNRAVLLLLAPAAGIAGAMALLRGSGSPEIALSALFGLAAALAGWAFARELVPDMERLAFLSMLLTFGAFLTVESSSLLLLFTAQFLVRVVNRSVGLPARIVDSAFVAGLTVWAAWAGSFPGLALIGALAFGLDASMKERFRRHWIFAGICLAAAGLSLVQAGTVVVSGEPVCNRGGPAPDGRCRLRPGDVANPQGDIPGRRHRDASFFSQGSGRHGGGSAGRIAGARPGTGGTGGGGPGLGGPGVSAAGRPGLAEALASIFQCA